MEQDAVGSDRVREGVGRSPELCKLARAPWNDIRPDTAFTAQPTPDARIEFVVADGVIHDDKQIPITLRCGVPPRSAAEQPDLLRLPARDDPVEQRSDRIDVDAPSACLGCSGRHWQDPSISAAERRRSAPEQLEGDG